MKKFTFFLITILIFVSLGLVAAFGTKPIQIPSQTPVNSLRLWYTTSKKVIKSLRRLSIEDMYEKKLNYLDQIKEIQAKANSTTDYRKTLVEMNFKDNNIPILRFFKEVNNQYVTEKPMHTFYLFVENWPNYANFEGVTIDIKHKDKRVLKDPNKSYDFEFKDWQTDKSNILTDKNEYLNVRVNGFNGIVFFEFILNKNIEDSAKFDEYSYSVTLKPLKNSASDLVKNISFDFHKAKEKEEND